MCKRGEGEKQASNVPWDVNDWYMHKGNVLDIDNFARFY